MTMPYWAERLRVRMIHELGGYTDEDVTGEETPHMMTFDPAKWGDTELERWNGVVITMRMRLHRYMCCTGTTRCPEECRYKHLCAWTKDVQIMCGKELNRRSGDQK